MKNLKIIPLVAITSLILLIPFVFTLLGSGVDNNGWHWTFFDFIVAGALIFGTGLAYQLISNKGGTATYRAAVGVALATTFLLIWINGAVGIIGSENNPANLMYLGVIIIEFIGAVITRLKSHGMSRVLYITAIAQALVPIIALIIWRPVFSPGVVGVLFLNSFFVTLFIISGLLFQRVKGNNIK